MASKRLQKLKRIAKRTNGTVYQHIGASKSKKPRMKGTFGAASPVRIIDPRTVQL